MAKPLIILLLCLIANCTAAQITVDMQVSKAYEIALNKIPKHDRAILSKAGFKNTCIATIYEIDTLNKKDATDFSHIKIFSIYSSGVQTEDHYNREDETYMPMPCKVSFSQNKLNIDIPGFFYPEMHFIINKKRVTANYEEYYRDTILRLNLSKSKAERLIIPAQVSMFKLSRSNYKTGDVVYGEVEFRTQTYYKDDGGFNTGYIKKKATL